ncbi:MAG: hypothetical protein A3I66_15270 [Burkholderiales bacterium RIFCSPLOWO2_02_FULL_57_36]|nr:MAG: hypothetical protein A3I66_15270 [Burkholderiales bacterium RIFCSPLOWO2_02_FULL_57_36]
MDDIVKQAMAKWPNVPHCHGWLALDARGGWRMRDEQAQARDLSGDKIANATLLGFINRNYTHDDQGRWYFQNGPQRVYVDLEATPYIAHTDPAQGFVLHTGEPMPSIDAAWLTESGQLVLKSADKIAMLDDRDMAQCLSQLRMDGIAVTDEQLLEWLAGESATVKNLSLSLGNNALPVQRIRRDDLAAQFKFVPRPLADSTSETNA